MIRSPMARLALFAAPILALGTGCQDSVSGPPSAEDFDLNPGFALADSATDVSLRVEADVFEPGGEVVLILENGEGEQIGYNLCFHAIEERVGGDWRMMEVPRICTTELRILGPGQSVSYETVLPTALEAGEYRFRIAIHFLDREESRDLASNPFQLTD
jgi:hypothetical protein